VRNPRTQPGVAIVTGAGGQDGYFLTERLLNEGWEVHAAMRAPDTLEFTHLETDVLSQLHRHKFDLLDRQAILDLITEVQSDEFYNLAGQSSVSQSFVDPIETWRTNAEAVVYMLEAIRKHSRQTRFYQASSTDMFGVAPSGLKLYGEESPLNPQSPYASAKAAAHLLCHSYREVFGLRIASGILSNHESYRRPASFLTRKVVDHVQRLRRLGQSEPLIVGNLKSERDWGYAPDYVEGMCRILRQIETRATVAQRTPEADEGVNYRDYVLATGKTHAVWELIDRAFTIGGFALEWDLEGSDPAAWRAHFRATNTPAVTVNPELLRAAEPLVIGVDPSRAENELGWAPRRGPDVFLSDMLAIEVRDAPVDRTAGA
jgi:GDPmannose 4,6-dehydratase